MAAGSYWRCLWHRLRQLRLALLLPVQRLLVGGRSGGRFLGFGRNLLLVLLLLPANVGIPFSMLAINFVAGRFLSVQVRNCVIERLGINSS